MTSREQKLEAALRAILEDEMSDLRKSLADKARQALAEPMDGWISVKTRLPDIGVPVWLYEDGNCFIGGRCDAGDGWLWGKCYDSKYLDDGVWKCDDIEWDDEYEPTMWQPLPQPPPAPSEDACSSSK